MAFGTGPAHPWLLTAGVGLVAFSSVPFGLAVGALAPRELEGVLVLIGVVGVQLTLQSTQVIAKILPFWGAQRLLQHSIDGSRRDRSRPPGGSGLRRCPVRGRDLHHGPALAGGGGHASALTGLSRACFRSSVL
jgi:hypothetical protein